MKGEQSRILGTIGDFEIGAKWQWKFQFHTVTVCLLAILVALVAFIAVGCVCFWSQLAELSNTRLELVETRLQMLEIQRTVQSELEQIRRLKQDLDAAINIQQLTDPNYYPANDDGDVNRSKRSIAKGRGEHKITAVHLERNVSFAVTGSSGIISRWHPQYWQPSFTPDNIQLDDHNSSLVIQTTGLYFIYAQLCYASTKENNSFELRLMNQGGTNSQSKIIAQCSAGTSILDNDITCFTSVAQVLQAGDRIFLQQLQKNRQLLMSMGRSFMGVIKLSN